MKYSISLFLLLLLSSLTFISCQDSNSNSTDRIVYSDLIEDPADSCFGPAFKVITNRCINCHSSTTHDVWGNYLTTQAWVDSGDIVINSLDQSKLITRMKNYNANETMPQGGGAIPADEYEALTNWVKQDPKCKI